MADFEFNVNLQADKLVQQAISNANANRALAETTRVKTKQIKAVVDDLVLPAVTGDKDKTNQGVRRDLDDPAAHRIERLEPAPGKPDEPTPQMWLMACTFDVVRDPNELTYATCSLSLNNPAGGLHDSVVFSFDNCEENSGNYDYEARPPIYFADNYDRNNFAAPPLASWAVCTKVDPTGNQPGAHYTYTTDEGYVGATWELGEGVITYALRPSFDLFGGSGINLHTYAGDQKGGYEEFEVYNAPDIQSWLLPYKWNEAYFVVHYTPPKSYWVDYCYTQEVFCTSDENVSFIHTASSEFDTTPEGLYRGNISQATYRDPMWRNYWDPTEERFRTYVGNDYRTGEWGEGVVNSLSNIKVFKLIIDPINWTDGQIEEVPLNETIRFNLEIPFPPFYQCFGTTKPTRYSEPYATYESAMINEDGVGSGMNMKTYETTKRNYLDFEVKIPWEPPPFSDRLEEARVGTLLNFPYSNRAHRYRLLPQAYGIGALLTDDHMKFNVMVPAPPPIDWYTVKLWFGDSFFYSPMIYDYFSTFTATSTAPALSDAYDDVFIRATRMEPETIIDKDKQGNWVEKEIYTPAAIFIDINQAGPDGGIQLSLFDSNYGEAGRPLRISSKFFAPVVRVKNIPGLRTATHYAYNWGNPWYCWDRLKEFGIPEDVLGPRPAFDYNKTIPDSRW